MAEHNITGRVGEDIASKWLISKGHKIIDRNYRKKWGEIDIISEFKDKIHFVEVKSVSYETRAKLNYYVSHETWRPEDRVHMEKLRRLSRAIQTWLQENSMSREFQVDVLTVKIVPGEKYSTVKVIENVTFE